MNCQSLRNWLLQAESLQPKSWPPEVVKHLKSCARCVKYVNSLAKLEKSWREQPVSAECTRAKASFLNIMTTLVKTAPAKPAVRRWRPARSAAVAAMVLLGISAFAWMFFSPSGQSRAADSDIVDRLVHWNAKLTNADAEERKRWLSEEEPKLRNDFQKDSALLSDEERLTAAVLLETGVWFATNDNRIEEAKKVNHIADRLLAHAIIAEKLGNQKECERCGKRYCDFNDDGVKPFQEKITKIILVKPTEKKGPRFEQWEKQNKQFEKIFERSQERSRTDLHKKFEGLFKKGGGKR